jgi:acyl-CoA thioester hydrolase
MGEPFVHTVRVRYGECDAQSVVFNAHYLGYVDDTITELWRAAFGGYGRMLERGVDIVVAEANLRFRGAARFDEVVTIEATVSHLGTTSVGTSYRFLRDGELLLEAEMRHVFVTLGTAEKTPIPDWARTGLAPWAELAA